MLCKKILNSPKIGIGISSLVFVLGLFFSVFFATDTFAIDNYVYTLDSSNSSDYFYLCGSNSGRSCFDYSYFSVSYSSSDISTMGAYPAISFFLNDASTFNFFPRHSTFTYFDILDISSLKFNGRSGLNNFIANGGSFTFTLYVDSPFSSPSGTLNITENGTFDVTSYASAFVDVPPIYGDYHDDLVNIYHAILICGAILLVIYFFYCIYRMIIKSTGGQ